jgi:predicted nucleic acid-binding protein
LLTLIATAGIRGGQVYDALVAATAKQANALLLTLNNRARSTYRLIGVNFQIPQ